MTAVNHADKVVAWRPDVFGIAEVLHARWADHAYPAHTHDTWAVLLVDDGVIGYDLDRHRQAAVPGAVTILPPHVVHDGRPVTSTGFTKRVIYLEGGMIDMALVGRAVDHPLIADDALREVVSRLDRALTSGADLAAESMVAMVAERLAQHLSRDPGSPRPPANDVACALRDMFDADPVAANVRDSARVLGVSVPHAVRSFSRAFGVPPHRYLIGRRLDRARRALLDGTPPALVATQYGFYDQAHFTRHFRALLSTPPGAFVGRRINYVQDNRASATADSVGD